MQRIAGSGHIHEEVAGKRFRITGRSFFQNNTAGAEHLVHLVDEALEPRESDTLLDAFAGGGLFAATVGGRVDRVIAIEGSATAVNDLRANLAAAGVEAKVRKGRVTEALHDIGEYWDLAICDPPRKGLGSEGVEAITSAMPRRIAYVSCDPASLARDTRLILDAGYELAYATPVDMFPQTYHIETVAAFQRTG